MTATITRQLVVHSPEMIAIVDSDRKAEWRQFAHGVLTTFEGHRPGYEKLFEDSQVMDTIMGNRHGVNMLWPGWLMSAMRGRGYEIMTSCPELYERAAHMTEPPVIADPPLTDKEWMLAIQSSRVLSESFNTGLSDWQGEAVVSGEAENVAAELIRSGWAVMFVPREGNVEDSGSHALYPGFENAPQSGEMVSGSMTQFIMHALRHPMY